MTPLPVTINIVIVRQNALTVSIQIEGWDAVAAWILGLDRGFYGLDDACPVHAAASGEALRTWTLGDLTRRLRDGWRPAAALADAK